MIRVVYKYALELKRGPQVVMMPKGAFIVHAHAQDGRPVVWTEVDPGAPKADWHFYVIATGEPVAFATLIYVGTVHIGPTVWHIYRDMVGREVMQ